MPRKRKTEIVPGVLGASMVQEKAIHNHIRDGGDQNFIAASLRPDEKSIDSQVMARRKKFLHTMKGSHYEKFPKSPIILEGIEPIIPEVSPDADSLKIRKKGKSYKSRFGL
jgi:hypothetical protein